MDNGKPLAAARERLRRNPGRPRKGDSGHNRGITLPREPMNSGEERSALAPGASMPRLLSQEGVAHYLGISVWTVREWEEADILRRVEITLPNSKTFQRALYDVRDLDALIDQWKNRR